MELAGRIAGRIREINKGEVVGFCLGFMLAMGGMWDLSPSGPASACAGRMLGRRWGPALGAVVGAAVFGRWTSLCHSALFLLLTIIWEGCTRPRRRDYNILLICGGLLTAPFFYIESVYDAMTGLAQISGAVVLCAAFCRCGRAISRVRLGRELGERELTALFITFGCLCAGGSCVTIADMTVGGMLAAFFAMTMCRTAGAYAVAGAAVCGCGLVLSGGDIGVAGAMVTAALAACRLERRVYICLAYFAVTGFCCYYGGYGTGPIAETVIGAGMCMLLPKVWLDVTANSISSETQARNRLKGMEGRMKDAATVLGRVSDMLEDCPESQGEVFAGKQLRCMSEAITAIPPPRQANRFRMVCGGASCPKEGSREAGDSMAAREICGGKLVIISDGMGSGALARRESRAAVSLIGDLMSIGVREMDALDWANRLLICKGEYDMYATLDAMTFDYANGGARFLKLGAPPTYILRQGEVTELSAETLPIGIVEAIRPARKEIMLLPGDAVIMATDGITDALGEGMVAAITALGAESDPREMARTLLLSAMSKGRNDDMSVMVSVVKEG